MYTQVPARTAPWPVGSACLQRSICCTQAPIGSARWFRQIQVPATGVLTSAPLAVACCSLPPAPISEVGRCREAGEIFLDAEGGLQYLEPAAAASLLGWIRSTFPRSVVLAFDQVPAVLVCWRFTPNRSFSWVRRFWSWRAPHPG